MTRVQVSGPDTNMQKDAPESPEKIKIAQIIIGCCAYLSLPRQFSKSVAANWQILDCSGEIHQIPSSKNVKF